VRFCDEQDFGFGWIDDEDPIRRTSHALVVEGGVWLIDPVAWPEAEQRALEHGRPRGVLQLLDRHNRDCAAIAATLGVPHHVVPTHVPPFEFLPVLGNRFWREVALWWPERRVLAVAEAVGTNESYTLGQGAAGVQGTLRLRPPRHEPEHVVRLRHWPRRTRPPRQSALPWELRLPPQT